MKRKSLGLFLVFLAVSLNAQTSLASATGRIQGSDIVLTNLSKKDFDKIMQGSIFDVFTLELRPSDYNTDLKKATFLETSKGKDYLGRLEDIKKRVSEQGIRTIQGQTTKSTLDRYSTISDYDVNRGGFLITLDGGRHDPLYNIYTGRNYIPNINGYEIPGLNFTLLGLGLTAVSNEPYPPNSYFSKIFIPVPVNIAQKIEGNKGISVQLQLSIDSFAIQKVLLINENTNEIYAEAENFVIQ